MESNFNLKKLQLSVYDIWSTSLSKKSKLGWQKKTLNKIKTIKTKCSEVTEKNICKQGQWLHKHPTITVDRIIEAKAM